METFNLVCKGRQNKKLDKGSTSKKPSRPHVLEVAQSLQDMLDAGVVNSRADLARRLGVSRARVTQLLNLLELHDEIRREILGLPAERQRCFTERRLRAIVALPSAEEQAKAFSLMGPPLAD